MLGVRHSVFLDDAFRRQVGNGATEAVSADVISPRQAVPPGQAKVRYLPQIGRDQIRKALPFLRRPVRLMTNVPR